MRFQIAGHGAEQGAVGVLRQQMLRLPAGAGAAEPEASSDDRKSCEMNGLSTCPRVENFGDELSSCVSLTAGSYPPRRRSCRRCRLAQASQAAAGTSASDCAMRMRSSMSVIGAQVVAPALCGNRSKFTGHGRSGADMRLWPKALENHLVGVARRARAVVRCAPSRSAAAGRSIARASSGAAAGRSRTDRRGTAGGCGSACSEIAPCARFAAWRQPVPLVVARNGARRRCRAGGRARSVASAAIRPGSNDIAATGPV